MKMQYICTGVILFGCDPYCVHAEPHDLCHYSDNVDCQDQLECQVVESFVRCEKVMIQERHIIEMV